MFTNGLINLPTLPTVSLTLTLVFLRPRCFFIAALTASCWCLFSPLCYCCCHQTENPIIIIIIIKMVAGLNKKPWTSRKVSSKGDGDRVWGGKISFLFSWMSVSVTASDCEGVFWNAKDYYQPKHRGKFQRHHDKAPTNTLRGKKKKRQRSLPHVRLDGELWSGFIRLFFSFPNCDKKKKKHLKRNGFPS